MSKADAFTQPHVRCAGTTSTGCMPRRRACERWSARSTRAASCKARAQLGKGVVVEQQHGVIRATHLEFEKAMAILDSILQRVYICTFFDIIIASTCFQTDTFHQE